MRNAIYSSAIEVPALLFRVPAVGPSPQGSVLHSSQPSCSHQAPRAAATLPCLQTSGLKQAQTISFLSAFCMSGFLSTPLLSWHFAGHKFYIAVSPCPDTSIAKGIPHRLTSLIYFPKVLHHPFCNSEYLVIFL